LSLAPEPAKLRLATLIFSAAAWPVTQLIPQRICDSVPLPDVFITLTAYSLVPGATPTTPEPWLRAPMIPATFVPCPLSSWAAPPAGAPSSASATATERPRRLIPPPAPRGAARPAARGILRPGPGGRCGIPGRSHIRAGGGWREYSRTRRPRR